MAGNKEVDPTLGNTGAAEGGNTALQVALLVGFIVLGIVVCCCLVRRRLVDLHRSIRTSPTKQELEERKKFVDKYLVAKEWTVEVLEQQVGNHTVDGLRETLQNGDENINIESETKEHDQTDCCVDCSICLTRYEKGDDVAWSTNESCTHSFHKDCVYAWLLKHDECPMCRNIFLLEPDIIEQQPDDSTIP